MKRAAGIVGVAIAVLLVAAIARIALYRQRDDPERLALKREYLQRIASRAPAGERPSFVLVVFDDLGAGDLGAYGARAPRTPVLDGLAAEGMVLRQAYSASPYCSAARAALMTGRYAVQAGLDIVLQPSGTVWSWLLRLGGRNLRLPAEEITLPEVLSAAGYATAMVGKWHLGESSPSLPNDRGFDRFYGLLHSNDQGWPRVWRDRTVVERAPIDQTTLTRRYTEEAVRFIEEAGEGPFFLYLPHTFPHIPLHVRAELRGRSDAGLYGDVVEELDRSVGRVLEALERRGAAESTLVLVTSDNGPWFQGSPAGLRGRKLEIFEGGLRVPLLARWPGRIPAGAESDAVVTGLDLFPTLLELAGLPLPADREIAGASRVEVLEGKGETGPERPFFYFQLGELRAVRLGRFKYHDRHGVFFGNPMDWPWGPMKERGPWLFDLALDPSESYDVSDRHPEVAERLARLLAERREEQRLDPRGWRKPALRGAAR